MATTSAWTQVDPLKGNLKNTTNGKITNFGTGKIVLKSNVGYFGNMAPVANITNYGTIEFNGTSNIFADTAGLTTGVSNILGASATNRIHGNVIYTSTTTATVQPRWYDSLGLGATGVISFSDSTYVGAAGASSGIKPLYLIGTPGARTYATGSKVVYDAVNSQIILGEANYANLELANGDNTHFKTVAATETVKADNITNTSTNASVFSINGTLNIVKGLTLKSGSSNMEIDGASALVAMGVDSTVAYKDIVLKNGGTLTANGTNTSTNGQLRLYSLLDVQNGAVTLSGTSFGIRVDSLSPSQVGKIQLASTSATLTMGAGDTMSLSNSFIPIVNNKADRSNTTFDVASYVKYISNNAQKVISTSSAKPYGNFEILGTGTKSGSANTGSEEDIYVAGNFTATGGVLDMYNSGGTANNKAFFFTDNTKTVTYNDTTSEVVGKFSRTGNFATGSTYIYNNAETKVTFPSTAPATGKFFAVSSRPGVDPTNFDATLDVRRKVTLDYTTDATFAATVRVGYKYYETGQDTAARWLSNSYNEDMIRFYESESKTAPNTEKLATGSPYVRTHTTTAMHYVELPNISQTSASVDGTADSLFKYGNDLVLRSGPSLFTTKAHGRWSNPGTWDEGVAPSAIDQTLIRHQVHVGYVRQNDPGANGQITEIQPNLAAKITIDSVTSTDIAGAQPLLIFGGSLTYGINNAAVPGITHTGSLNLKFNNDGGTALPVGLTTASDDASSANILANTGLMLFKDVKLNVKENLNNEGKINSAGTINVDPNAP